MRLYDHYYFRHFVKQKKVKKAKGLSRSEEWTKPYFAGPKTLKHRDRVLFSGGNL
jgi:hypothetical protein